MDIAPLPIKLLRQDPSSDDCGRCCGFMLFNFLGDPITKEEVWRKLHVYQKHSGLWGSYLADLGRLAILRKHKATIYHCDWHRWDKAAMEAAGKGESSLIKALKTLKQHQKNWGQKKEVAKEIAFVKKGGQYKIEIPKLSTIDLWLQKRLPVILAVRAEDLYRDPQETYSHFILVVGKKNNTYLIKDPYLAIDEVSADELYYAWSRQGGWLMAVRPAKEKEDQLPLFNVKS